MGDFLSAGLFHAARWVISMPSMALRLRVFRDKIGIIANILFFFFWREEGDYSLNVKLYRYEIRRKTLRYMRDHVSRKWQMNIKNFKSHNFRNNKKGNNSRNVCFHRGMGITKK